MSRRGVIVSCSRHGAGPRAEFLQELVMASGHAWGGTEGYGAAYDGDHAVRTGWLSGYADAGSGPGNCGALPFDLWHDRRGITDARRGQHHAADELMREDPAGSL